MTIKSAEAQLVERMIAARRMASQYHAEADGLLWALFDTAPAAALFCDECLHVAYLRGFREGRMILDVAAPSPETAVAAE